MIIMTYMYYFLYWFTLYRYVQSATVLSGLHYICDISSCVVIIYVIFWGLQLFQQLISYLKLLFKQKWVKIRVPWEKPCDLL